MASDEPLSGRQGDTGSFDVRIGRVEERVDSLSSSVRQLIDGVKSLTTKVSENQRTPWGTVIGVIGLMLPLAAFFWSELDNIDGRLTRNQESWRAELATTVANFDTRIQSEIGWRIHGAVASSELWLWRAGILRWNGHNGVNGNGGSTTTGNSPPWKVPPPGGNGT